MDAQGPHDFKADVFSACLEDSKLDEGSYGVCLKLLVDMESISSEPVNMTKWAVCMEAGRKYGLWGQCQPARVPSRIEAWKKQEAGLSFEIHAKQPMEHDELRAQAQKDLSGQKGQLDVVYKDGAGAERHMPIDFVVK